MAYKQYYINYGIFLSERPILNILIRIPPQKKKNIYIYILIRIGHIIFFSSIRLYLKSQCCFLKKKKITMFVKSLIVMSVFITFANVSFGLPPTFCGSLNLNQLTLFYQSNLNLCT